MGASAFLSFPILWTIFRGIFRETADVSLVFLLGGLIEHKCLEVQLG
jgi:hypothetical protein